MQINTAYAPNSFHPLPPLKGTLERGLWRALHSRPGSLARWDYHRCMGLNNFRLKQAVGQEFGVFAGLSGPDIESIAWRGGDDPALWWGGWSPGSPPTLRGRELIKRVREILDIPHPVIARH